MRRVPGWGVVSATAAPVLLIGGWTLAARRQPPAYDAARDTISALAAHGAQDRWIMTVALAGLGLCHVVTASALWPVARPARLLLAAGGAGTMLVAAAPLSRQGTSTVHGAAAGVAFGALAAWPLLAARGEQRRSAPRPRLLRPGSSVVAGCALLALVGWFAVELAVDSDRVGLAERAAAGAQALWPLAVVTAARVVR